MNRMVLGIVVDDDIYDKYQFDKETGRRRMYTLCGKELSLDAIEFYEGSADYAKESPELVKEAKRIAEGIRKEIKQHYVAKDGREEYIAMKHDTFEEYLRDLQEIHAKVAPERRELKQKWDEAQKRWQEDQREYKNDEHYLAREKVLYLDAQEDYKNRVRDLQQRTQEEIQAVQTEYEKHVTDFYAANGNRLDDAAVRLLNSGIKLTDAEIDGMVSQNTGNPTMLRLISDHCDKQGIGTNSARIYGSLARKSGADEREAFKAVAGMVQKAVSTEEITADIWSKADSHFQRLSDQQIGDMGKFWVRPETSQTRAVE